VGHDVTEMFPETLKPGTGLALDHAPNEIHGT